MLFSVVITTVFIDLTVSTIIYTNLNEFWKLYKNNLTHSTPYNDQNSTKYSDRSASKSEEALQ